MLTRAAREPTEQWRYGALPDHVADVFAPQGQGGGWPPVVLVHGGFWRPEYDRAHLRPFAAALSDRGHLVVSLEYRRTPGAPDDAVDDVLEAIRRVTDVDAPASGWRQVQVIGHSAGGHLALLASAAAVDGIGSCLALAPVADLALAERLDLDGGAVGAFLGGPASARPDLDPSRLPPPHVPVTLLHGADDDVVPLTVSQSYGAAMTAAMTVRVAAPPRIGHFALIDPASPAWILVLDEIDALTRRPAAP